MGGTGVGKGGGGAWRIGDPEVLTDLCRHDKPGDGIALKELGRAERHLAVTRERHERHVLGAGREAPALVELAIGGDVALGHEAQQLTGAQHRGAVVELGGHAHGHAHEHERVHVCRELGKARKALLGRAEQRILPEEVLAGIGGDGQLG